MACEAILSSFELGRPHDKELVNLKTNKFLFKKLKLSHCDIFVYDFNFLICFFDSFKIDRGRILFLGNVGLIPAKLIADNRL